MRAFWGKIGNENPEERLGISKRWEETPGK